MPDPCPSCRSVDTVDGRCLGQLDQGFGFVFRPAGLKLLAFIGTDVHMSQRFTACLECGLLWSSINNKKLAKAIARKGGRKLKERLVHRLLEPL